MNIWPVNTSPYAAARALPDHLLIRAAHDVLALVAETLSDGWTRPGVRLLKTKLAAHWSKNITDSEIARSWVVYYGYGLHNELADRALLSGSATELFRDRYMDLCGSLPKGKVIPPVGILLPALEAHLEYVGHSLYEKDGKVLGSYRREMVGVHRHRACWTNRMPPVWWPKTIRQLQKEGL